MPNSPSLTNSDFVSVLVFPVLENSILMYFRNGTLTPMGMASTSCRAFLFRPAKMAYGANNNGLKSCHIRPSYFSEYAGHFKDDMRQLTRAEVCRRKDFPSNLLVTS